MKGVIALDIDGTITADANQLSKNVAVYLTSLAVEGWRFFFLTGRSFQWGFRTLSELPFPFWLAVQNGALLLEMPARKVIGKKYLTPVIFPYMEQICQGEPCDFVIYSGYENQDACYFRPHKFSPQIAHYLQERRTFLNERWLPLNSFQELEVENFPSIKCFGSWQDLERVKQKIEKLLQLHAPMVKDPFDPAYYVLQATKTEVDKGQALKQLVALSGKREIVIAAGDDQNDLAMFEWADIKIAMATAPQSLLEKADIIAPAASEEGIVKGLQEAIHRIRK